MKKLMAIAALACAGTAFADGVAVSVEKPRLVTEDSGVTFVGRVTATQTVRLTARVSGMLLESNGEDGAPVKKGEVLFRIEDTVYRANLQTAKAQLAELEARLRNAETEVERYSAGAVKGGVSKAELDRAVLNRDVTKAQIEAAKAKVILCEDDLAHCVIASPIDGVLGPDSVDAGNNVGPESGTLREVFTTDPVDVSVAVPERIRIACMESGEEHGTAKFTLLRVDGKPCPIMLKIKSVNKRVETATGTVRVTLSGANPDCAILPGGYVKLLVQEVFKTPRLAVPVAAVSFEGEERYVYVVADGRAAKRRIEPGDQSGNLLFVRSGLAADEDVVVSGIHKLADGIAVSVK